MGIWVSGPNLQVWHLFGLIILAMVLGGLVGLDREIVQRPAGLRTHMLVAGAAAVFVGLGEMLVQGYGAGPGRGHGTCRPPSAHPGHHHGGELPGRRRHHSAITKRCQ